MVCSKFKKNREAKKTERKELWKNNRKNGRKTKRIEEQQNGIIYVRVNNLMDLNQMASMKTNETVRFAS